MRISDKRYIVNWILSKDPDFHLIGEQCIYVKPVEHFINGFFIEFTGRATYLYQFIFPLFYKEEEINFSFSKRLNSTNVEYKNLNRDTIAEQILLHIRLSKDKMLLQFENQLDRFIADQQLFFKQLDARGLSATDFPQNLIPSIYARLILGELKTALPDIDDLLESQNIDNQIFSDSDKSDLVSLKKLIIAGETQALQAKLRSWENQMRKHWNLA